MQIRLALLALLIPATAQAQNFTQQAIASIDFPNSVHAADLNGDGDLDLLTHYRNGTNNGFYWYESTANGTSWTPHLVSVKSASWTVHGADMDGDGDTDFLGTTDTSVYWWSNDDGLGTVWTEHLISSGHSFAGGIWVSDINGDGDLDVSYNDFTQDNLFWAESSGGLAPTWTIHTVDGNLNGARWAYTADITGDGNLDIVAGAQYDGVYLYSNVGGTGTAWGATALGTTNARGLALGDMDGDTDIDIFSIATNGVVTAFTNPGASGSWTSASIATGISSGYGLDAGDIDNDGDLDLITLGIGGNLHKLVNSGGTNPTFTTTTVGSASAGRNVFLAYIDTNGSLDFFCAEGAGDAVSWWQSDLVVVGNTPPTVTAPANTTINEGGTTGPLAATVNDTEDGPNALVLTATSSNTTLFPAGSITFGGAGSSRTVTATPAANENGSAAITLSTADSQGATTSATFTITVTDVNDDPVADAGPTAGTYTAPEGSALLLDASGSSDIDGSIVGWDWDCDGNGTYETSAATATSGICTFTDDGTFPIVLQVTDDDGGTATATTTATISNVAPTITSSPTTSLEEGTLWGYSPTASDPGADAFTWSVTSAPGSLSVAPLTGALDWTPSFADVGSHLFTLSVSDGDGGTDTQSMNLVVGFLDDDVDGMPDTWEAANGLSSLDPADAFSDADADGLSALNEYLGGTDPNIFDGPDVPVPTAPIGGAEVASATPSLEWSNATDPQGEALTYDLEVYGDAAFAVLLATVTALPEQASSSWTVDVTLPENGEVWWRVRAADPNVAGTWSDLADFFVSAVEDTPEVPVLIEPLDVDVDSRTPRLVWSDAVDPDRDDGTFELQVEDATGTLVVEETRPWTARDADFTVATDLVENATYLWRVRAIDDTGLESAWSDDGTFLVNTENSAPDAITFVTPEQDEAIVGYSPTLTATESIDAEGGALNYLFQLDTTDTFSSIDLKANTVPHNGGGTVSWDLEASGDNLTENVTWYARVRAEDGAGATSSWANVSFFVRGDNDGPLEAPVLLAPDDGNASSNASPVFEVGHAIDPEGDALTYEFTVTSDEALADVVTSATAIEPGAGSAGTADQTSWEGDLDTGTYYWSARAVDAEGGESPWADPWEITIRESTDSTNDCACASSQAGPSGPPLWFALLGLLGVFGRRRR